MSFIVVGIAWMYPASPRYVGATVYLDTHSAGGWQQCYVIHVFCILMLVSAGNVPPPQEMLAVAPSACEDTDSAKIKMQSLNFGYHSLVLFGGSMAILRLQMCWSQWLSADPDGPFVSLYSSIFISCLTKESAEGKKHFLILHLQMIQ